MKICILPLLCLAFFVGCFRSTKTANATWYANFAANYERYYAAATPEEKRRALSALLKTVEDAERQKLFEKSPGFLAENRVFILLRSCANEYSDGRIERANYYRELAARTVADHQLSVLGGRDFSSPSSLTEIRDAILALDKRMAAAEK